jgi:hypothetical protein
MSGLIAELEEAIVLFVKERVPSHKWKYLNTRQSIVALMEDDDVDELKEHFFAMMMDAVKWRNVVDDIDDMVQQQEEEEREEESSGDDDIYG